MPAPRRATRSLFAGSSHFAKSSNTPSNLSSLPFGLGGAGSGITQVDVDQPTLNVGTPEWLRGWTCEIFGCEVGHSPDTALSHSTLHTRLHHTHTQTQHTQIFRPHSHFSDHTHIFRPQSHIFLPHSCTAPGTGPRCPT